MYLPPAGQSRFVGLTVATSNSSNLGRAAGDCANSPLAAVAAIMSPAHRKPFGTMLSAYNKPEIDIHRIRRMRDRAAGNEIGSGLGVAADRLQSNAARQLH